MHARRVASWTSTYPCCGSSFTDTTDNPSGMCPSKITIGTHSHPEKMPDLNHHSYTILQGPHIPPRAFTSCHDPRSNLQSPDESSIQPIRLA